MTDLSLPLSTHTASTLNSVGRPSSSTDGRVVSNTAGEQAEEEEDYTIKCFCNFQVDDGNTVFCDRCETWQHIECYYFQDFQDGHPPDINRIVHSCIDCDPRPYDKKGATERQRDRFYPEERKVKKAPTKTPKRRPKLSESNAGFTNGYSHDGNESSHYDRTSGSPREYGPPLKRPKTSHRSSHSINFFSPPHNAETSTPKANGQIPGSRKSYNTKHSPNGYQAPPYSPEFLQLYDDDPGEAPIQANLFHDIAITRSLSSWSHDVESLSEAANGLSPQDIFHRCDESLDHMNLPCLRKEQRLGEPPEGGGRPPRWTYLTVDTETPRDAIVGELRGKIGHMRDYVYDPANRWDYLRHPAPFVFFHPKLPIYVDTRQEGSICRYLRRSCRPNLEMRTILENGTDYRFCFIAKEDIVAGSELTISWTLDQHIRTYYNSLNNPEMKREESFDVTGYISDWVEKVLANFGGCACESPDQCGLAKYDRRNRSLSNSFSIPNGKPAKVRNGYNKSVKNLDVDHNPNSRASSEGKKRQDDDGRDSRSTSGSNPRSRDMTPTRHGNCDSGTVPGLELSDREKRKIVALEKNFEQLEQEKHQPVQKKKKRNSGGSALSTPTVANSVRSHFLTATPSADRIDQKQFSHNLTFTSQPNTPAVSSRPRYIDASTSDKKSRSPVMISRTNGDAFAKRSAQPNGPGFASPSARPNYVSSSVQTDGDEPADSGAPPSFRSQKRRPYISLGKRLLLRCQQDRERLEDQRRASIKGTDAPPNRVLLAEKVALGSATILHQESSTNTTLKSPSLDVEIADAFSEASFINGASHPESDPQTDQPPDGEAGLSPQSRSPEIKQPRPSATSQVSSKASGMTKPINGFRSTELRVQLPSIPPLPHYPSSTPAMTTSIVARSLFSSTPSTYPPLFTTSSPGAIQPSPVKKVSLSEYFSRSKNKTQPVDKAAASSPTSQQSLPKLPSNADEETKNPTLDGGPLVNTPVKEGTESPAARKASV